MAIGSLVEFPISTILEFSTSGQHGLCPQLCGSIHEELSACNFNTPVSERGIRLALDSADTNTSYTNLGNGQPIYAYMDAPTAFYNTISADSQYITGFISGDTLFLSGYGTSGSTITSGSTATSPISIQGGRYQYSDTFAASAIQTSGYVIGYPIEDDLLAKTFIKCTVPFEQNGSTYSIGVCGGTWEDKNLITSGFPAPSAEGLVDFTYSNTMSAEYYWLTGNSELRIYRYGSQCTSGEIGVTTFYDNVAWSPSYGYIMGNNQQSIPIERYNLNFDYLDTSSRVDALAHMKFYTSISYNSYIYSAGGETTGPTNHNNISRYETKNDTVSLLDRGDLSTARGRLSSCKSSLRLYFCGGQIGGSTESAVIDNIAVTNDTATASNDSNLTTARDQFCNVSSSTATYFCGGFDTSSALSSVEKMVFIGNVMSSSTALTTARGKMYGWDTSVYGFITCGSSSSSTADVNYLDKLTLSDGTVVNVSSTYFTIPVEYGYTTQNSSNGYVMQGYNTSAVNIIQKTNFNTLTTSIVDGKCLNSYAFQWAASV